MAEEHHTDFLPLMEERATVTKEKIVTGRVRVSTHTEAVESLVPLELGRMEVEVVRVPVDRKVDKAPEVVVDGDLTIIPIVEERLVVVRELYVREELHIRRVEHRDMTEVPVTTRRQTASVERLLPEDDR